MTSAFGAESTADEVLANRDLNGKRFFITGAAGGIGLETARALASRGAAIVGAVRNIQKAEQAASIMRRTGADLELVEVDLASQTAIKQAADKLLASGNHFDAIIANAGIMATPFSKTVDGFESQFGVNHLGHFTLVNALAPLVVDNGRVVVLSSQAHRVADIDLNDPNFENQPYDAFVAYGRSKTASILYALEFDRRHQARGVRATSVMPGNAYTDLQRHFAAEALNGLVETATKARAESGLPPKALKTIPEAAATSVWAAVVADKDVIGGRYLEDCAIAPVEPTPNPFADGVQPYALDVERAGQLWTKSEALLQAL
tara:strand:+ start:9298 stop:10251 length:954 start_codon:yes stop_codon:yes gene_type:complete